MSFIIRIYLFVVSILGLAAYFFAPTYYDERYLFIVGSVGLFSYIITVWYLAIQDARFSWAGLFNFFCMSFVLVHFHNPIIAFFVEDIRESRKLWFAPEYACASVSISLVGFCVFLFCYIHWSAKSPRFSRNMKTMTLSPNLLEKLVFILAGLAGGCFIVFFALAGEGYRSGAYGGVDNYWGGGATYMFLLFRVFFFSTIILDLYRIRVSYDRLSIPAFLLRLNPVVVALAGGFLLVSFYVGDRGPILQVVMLYAGAYSIFFGKIRFIVFAGAILCGAAMMAFIGRYRTSDVSQTMEQKIEEGKYKMSESKWYHVTAELGGSFRCVAASEMIVNTNGPFYGLFKVSNFSSCIPFTSRILAPIYGPITSGVTSSQFLTSVIIGPTSRIGAGTTIIADINLDFGVVGVVVFMGVIGWFLAFLESRSSTGYSLMYFAAFLLFLSVAFYWPRSFFFPHPKVIAWGLMFIKLLHYSIGQNLRLSPIEILQRYRNR